MSLLTDYLPDFSRFIRSAGQIAENRFQALPRSVYIMPNKYGVMFAVLIIAMLIGSINYANNLGFMLTFFLAGVGIVSIVHTWLNLIGLQFNVLSAEPVFSGNNLNIPFVLVNTTDKFRGAIYVHFVDASTGKIVDLSASEKQQIFLPLATFQRGFLNIPKVVVETRYPLGLFRAWLYLQPSLQALVYAKPLASELPASFSSDGQSNIVSNQSGQDDFHSHRNYQKTDSPKHVDWKVLARSQTLKTKMFADSLSHELWLSTDLFPADNLENQLRLLTAAVLQAEEQGICYGLKLDHLELAPASGHSHRHLCLKALALYKL